MRFVRECFLFHICVPHLTFVQKKEKSRFADEWLLGTPGASELDAQLLRGMAVEMADQLFFLPADDLPRDITVCVCA